LERQISLPLARERTPSQIHRGAVREAGAIGFPAGRAPRYEGWGVAYAVDSAR
jgi:hypothetical protein